MAARKAARKSTRRSASKRGIKRAARPRSQAKRVLAAAGKKLRAVRKQAADVGEAALRAATRKGWREWFALLDQAGAKTMDHKGIVAVIGKARGVSGWWQQTITVAYERARGLHRKYQTTSGFNASGSKTVAAPISDLFDERLPNARAADKYRKFWKEALTRLQQAVT